MDTAKVTATKIAANPQDHTWAQAYSTLKLYIVLSVEDASQKTVAATGKEVLEKLQREFFALDEKNLEAIKNAVATVVNGLESEATISITLATIMSGALYLVVVGNGIVILSRDDKNGIIAKGEGKTPTSFSGKLDSEDNIALTTEEFLQKVPLEKIAAAFAEGDLQMATESIAPLIHTDSSGKEAAILLHYVDQVEAEEKTLAREDKTLEEEQDVSVRRASALSMLPAFHFSTLKGFLSPNILHDRKKLIILITLLLVITLLGSLLFDKLNAQSKQRQETLAQIIDPLQKKYDDAVSIAGINSTLALDELVQIKDAIDQGQEKLPSESNEGKKLADFEAKVNNKITELGGNPNGSASLKIAYDSTKNTDLGTVTAITSKGETLTAVGKNGKVGIITDGNVSKTFDSKASNVKTITADNTDIFILGDSIFKQPRGGGDATKIVSSPDGIITVDTFGGNVYGLSSKSIDKFGGSSYTKSSYLKDDAKLTGSPSDMSIDASIWVIAKDGTIQKFTRGAQDDFNVKNLSKPFGQNPKIYTDVDYANVYVLDSANGRVVTISKSGDAGREYKAKEMGHATSFAVDEPGKKLYILSGSKIYSLDL